MMKKILLILLLILSYPAGAAEKADYLKFDHNEIGFSRACTYYYLHNPDLPDISEKKLDSLKLSYWAKIHGDLINPVWEWETTTNYTVDKPVYVTKIEEYDCVNNITKEKETCNRTVSVFSHINKINKQKTEFKQFGMGSFSSKNIQIKHSDKQLVRFCADIKRVHIPGRGWTIEVDHIPVYDHMVYTSYTWWNSSYGKKMLINCTHATDGIPIAVNGSNGLCGGNQIVLTYCAGSGNALYYNILCGGSADYVVANDSTQLPMEVEKGNGTDYLNTTVWNRTLMTHHFNNIFLTDSSSFHVDQIQQKGSSSLQSGIFGDSVYFRGDTNYDINNNLGDIKANDFTIDFWMYNNKGYGNANNYVFYFADSGYLRCESSGGGVQCDEADNFCCYVYDGSTKTADIPAVDLSINTWYHVFWDYKQAVNSSIFLNNVLKDTLAINAVYNIDFENMIASHYNDNHCWNGSIDEFRVWTPCLTDSEKTTIYNNAMNVGGYGNLGTEETFTSFSVSLSSPPNETVTSDNTSDYSFLFTGTEATGNCSLYLNDTSYGSDDSVQNNTATAITSSEVSLGGYDWYVNCSAGGLTSQSEVWMITIVTTTTTTSTTSPIGGGSTGDYRVINVSSVPDTVLGTSKSNMLTMIALILIVSLILIFSAKLAGVGIFLAAAAVGFFSYIGWLPISGITLVVIYLIAFIFFITKKRVVT